MKQLARASIRLASRFSTPRRALNFLYTQLTYEQKQFCHRGFSGIYRDLSSRAKSGTWKVDFAGKKLLLPLKPERMWLDWDTALAILGHDIEVKKTYETLLKSGRRPDLFIDIGANYGTHSLLFLAHGVETIAFEPNTSCHAYFLEACALNQIQCQLEPVALGDAERNVRLTYPVTETWLGSVGGGFSGPPTNQGGTVEQEVQQRTLDSYMANFQNRRVLVKIDTEGHEHSILRGARIVVQTCKPLVIFECWRGEARQIVSELFRQSNYQLFHLPWSPTKEVAALTDGDFCTSAQTNFIAVHPS
jgi:FkbM family methyltransferase